MAIALSAPRAPLVGARHQDGRALPDRPSAPLTGSKWDEAGAPRIAFVCTDAELIQRTGAGDRTAFEKLYRRYARPVFGLALRRLGDRGRAEDALQETFVSVWRSA